MTDPVDIELVRSPQWIHDEQAEVGKKIWFEWKDIGLSGWATVTDIGRAPPLQGGKGRVVTSTITHHNSDVYKLAISGSDAPLEVTGVHLVYSATRHDFVRARDLKVGEELLTHSGAECHIKSILHESGTHRVYNFEVEHDHHYYVGDEQVLVHNSCTQDHHSDPKFMGGDRNQPLTTMSTSDHVDLHQDLNQFLKTKTDTSGNDMSPRRGNSGAEIRRNFTRQERIDAMHDFYNKYSSKYPQATQDFKAQNLPLPPQS